MITVHLLYLNSIVSWLKLLPRCHSLNTRVCLLWKWYYLYQLQSTSSFFRSSKTSTDRKCDEFSFTETGTPRYSISVWISSHKKLDLVLKFTYFYVFNVISGNVVLFIYLYSLSSGTALCCSLCKVRIFISNLTSRIVAVDTLDLSTPITMCTLSLNQVWRCAILVYTIYTLYKTYVGKCICILYICW